MQYLIKDAIITSREITDTTGQLKQLYYYVKQFDSSYGIKITCKSDNSPTYSESTFGITHSYEQAVEWVTLMAANEVTPITLHDIVDDLMF